MVLYSVDWFSCFNFPTDGTSDMEVFPQKKYPPNRNGQFQTNAPMEKMYTPEN